MQLQCSEDVRANNHAVTRNGLKPQIATPSGRCPPHDVDLFNNVGQSKYAFVSMLISLNELPSMCKIQKNICYKMRLLGVINVQKKNKLAVIYESGL